MMEQELKWAMTLLDEDQRRAVDEVRIGRWAVTNEDGVVGVYDKKAEAIDNALSSHGQPRNKSKVYRRAQGCYYICVLDPDEDPSEKFYHNYSLERITTENHHRFRELVVTARLPEWYFNPYSDDYKAWNATATESGRTK